MNKHIWNYWNTFTIGVPHLATFIFIIFLNVIASKSLTSGDLKIFCIATLFKIFLDFRDPKMLETSMNLRKMS